MRRYNQLFALLNKSGLYKQKEVLVLSYTGGRTESLREMTDKEYNSLLEYLRKEVIRGNPSDLENIKKKRSKVLYFAFRCGFAKGDQINWSKFNGWMLKYSVHKKAFNAYSEIQLNELISQFQSMYKKQTDEKSIHAKGE